MAKILVVDDSISVRKAVEKMLSPEGMEIVAAACVEDARDALLKATFDLVLCDVYLPDGDAFDVMASLASDNTSETAAVMMTGNLTSTLRERAEGAGFVEILAKPFKSEELTSTISSLLEVEEEEDRGGAWLDSIPRPLAVEAVEQEAERSPLPDRHSANLFQTHLAEPPADVGAFSLVSETNESHEPLPAVSPAGEAVEPLELEAPRWPTSSAVAEAIEDVLALDDVRSGVLIDGSGDVVYGAGAPSLGSLVRLSSRFANSTAAFLSESSNLELRSFVVEYGSGALMVERLEEGSLLGIDLKTRLAVSQVRQQARRILPGLKGALRAHAA